MRIGSSVRGVKAVIQTSVNYFKYSYFLSIPPTRERFRFDCKNDKMGDIRYVTSINLIENVGLFLTPRRFYFKDRKPLPLRLKPVLQYSNNNGKGKVDNIIKEDSNNNNRNSRYLRSFEDKNFNVANSLGNNRSSFIGDKTLNNNNYYKKNSNKYDGVRRSFDENDEKNSSRKQDSNRKDRDLGDSLTESEFNKDAFYGYDIKDKDPIGGATGVQTLPFCHSVAIFVDAEGIAVNTFVDKVIPEINKGMDKLLSLSSSSSFLSPSPLGESSFTGSPSSACFSPLSSLDNIFPRPKITWKVCLLRCFRHDNVPKGWNKYLSNIYVNSSSPPSFKDGSYKNNTNELISTSDANGLTNEFKGSAPSLPLSPTALVQYFKVDDYIPISIQLSTDVNHVLQLSRHHYDSYGDTKTDDGEAKEQNGINGSKGGGDDGGNWHIGNGITDVVIVVPPSDRAGYLYEAMQFRLHNSGNINISGIDNNNNNNDNDIMSSLSLKEMATKTALTTGIEKTQIMGKSTPYRFARQIIITSNGLEGTCQGPYVG